MPRPHSFSPVVLTLNPERLDMKLATPVVLLAGVLLAGSNAMAQFAKPEDAIKYRKAAFTLVGAHFSRLGAMATGKTPFDAKLAAENAEIVAELSKLPWHAFTEGTDKGETRAKTEIWTQAAKFKEMSDKFVTEASKLNSVAKTGQVDQIKIAFAQTADTCKACHDSFRSK